MIDQFDTTSDEILRWYAEGRRDFRGACLEDFSSLRGARLQGANFTGGFLSAIDFQNADLRDVRFDNSNVKTSDFRGANLSGASFRGALICSIYLAGADVTDACFDGAFIHSYELQPGELPPIR